LGKPARALILGGRDEQDGTCGLGNDALGSPAYTLAPVAERRLSQNTLLAQLDLGLVAALRCRSRSGEARTDHERHQGDDQQTFQRIHSEPPPVGFLMVSLTLGEAVGKGCF
jgi:hypothetical protein